MNEWMNECIYFILRSGDDIRRRIKLVFLIGTGRAATDV